jgi:oligopeptide/dipeptide ABC transporter ATP-binding protein
MGVLLQVDNLKTYFFLMRKTVKAVDGVSFDVHEGEAVALVGESGSGKSVVALSIMRLVSDPPGRVIGGRVFFEGNDLLALSGSEMRRIRGHRMAMIFQEPMNSLNPLLTIGRQLTEALELHLGMTRRAAQKRAAELLDEVNIPDAESRLYNYPHHFSGGMRQRAMIAMALSCNPRLLIADEPTTALDVTTQAEILELLRKLTTELGTAVVLITHDLGVVAGHADRVNVMYAGKVVERATASDLYRNPRHPYTLGLLASVPRLDQPKKERLEAIRGMPPEPSNLPPGCSFRARCRFAVERCARDTPSLEEVANDHHSACWVAAQFDGEVVHRDLL